MNKSCNLESKCYLTRFTLGTSSASEFQHVLPNMGVQKMLMGIYTISDYILDSYILYKLANWQLV